MSVPSFHIDIDPAIEETSFACDLKACRGACCTLRGGRGAPLLDEELSHILDILPTVLPTLPDVHQNVIDSYGAVEGPPGDYHTTCIDNAACVFVRFEGPVAHCAIEQAYHRGEIAWRKPLSCHLFPIRIDRGEISHIRFEYISECRPALQRGQLEGIPLTSFVADALDRAFGMTWSSLKERAKQ